MERENKTFIWFRQQPRQPKRVLVGCRRIATESDCTTKALDAEKLLCKQSK